MPVHETAFVHASAVIADGAVIGADCHIGPFCIVGPEVTLGTGVVLKSHVVVEGWTSIGDGTEVFPFASVGHVPQDLKFCGERTRLEIGARNRIREYVTMNPGTDGGGGLTKVGDDNLFMIGVHVGHDCILGNHIVMANNASLGGHCIVSDNVVIGALAGVHQFCRIGRGAMIGGLAAVVADVIPFGTVVGKRASLEALNLVGLKRRGADKADIQGLRAAFKEVFFGEGVLRNKAEALRGNADNNPLVEEVLDFILSESGRSFSTPSED